MIDIRNQGYFDRVVAFAARKGLSAEFEEQIEYLRRFADPDAIGLCKVVLSPDFAPASFGLTWMRGDRVWIVGGLVYHGSQDGWSEAGCYVDPFSCRLTDTGNPWMVHT